MIKQCLGNVDSNYGLDVDRLMSRRMPSRVTALCVLVIGCVVCSSCTYLQNAAKQSRYSKIQEANPSQRNLKHMIDRQTYFVYGRVLDTADAYAGKPVVVAAYSNRFTSNELVDVAHVANTGTHYGLNLPEGDYELLAFADQNEDGALDSSEFVGRRAISFDSEGYPDKVAGNVDIELSVALTIRRTVHIPLPEAEPLEESLFLPKGSIRSLDDSVFDSEIARLGIYEPAAFLEKAPTFLYALEEDSYRAPVLFVHGIGGSPREFAEIVAGLDRRYFKPWFFYYPSGSDLDQLAKTFYEIVLSGRALSASVRPLVVVAHSMGGLIVREAINRYEENGNENLIELFISIASPFGGHPGASLGSTLGPLVVPSWRDLSPDSMFLDGLFRSPLPPHVDHQLLFAYRDRRALKVGESSDGVVPLSSQLRDSAQKQATGFFGFDSSHTGVLEDPVAVEQVLEIINGLESPYPENHIQAAMAGGYDVLLNEDYTDREKYFIQQRGRYLSLLADGTLETLGIPVLEHFVDVAHGRAQAESDVETAWLKFQRDYPEN